MTFSSNFNHPQIPLGLYTNGEFLREYDKEIGLDILGVEIDGEIFYKDGIYKTNDTFEKFFESLTAYDKFVVVNDLEVHFLYIGENNGKKFIHPTQRISILTK